MSVKKREERATRVNLGGLDLSVENPKSAFPKEKRNSTWGQRKSQNEKRGTQHEGKGKLNIRENETQHKGKGKINMEEKGKLNMREKGNSTWEQREIQHGGKRETQHQSKGKLTTANAPTPKYSPGKGCSAPTQNNPDFSRKNRNWGQTKDSEKTKNLSRYPRFCI